MPPRKTTNVAPKKPVTRKRVVQEKKPTKSPILLIPTPQKSDPDSSTPKFTGKQLYMQKQIELANEVALAQLYKNAAIIDNVTTTKPKKKKTKPKQVAKTNVTNAKPKSKAPARRQIISEFFNETVEGNSAVVPKPTAKKTPAVKKNAAAKITPGPKKTVTNCPQIKSADSTVCKKGRPANRGRKPKETTPVMPRATTRNLRSRKLAVTGGEATAVRAATVSSRTNSGASSAPSWTRDISSSSATTCVTVDDFVRIDQRIPILQLPNIAASVFSTIPQSTSHTQQQSTSHTQPQSTSHTQPQSTSHTQPQLTLQSQPQSSESDSESSSSSSSQSSSASVQSSPPSLDQSPLVDILNLSISSSEQFASDPSDLDALFRQLDESCKDVDQAFDDWMNEFTEPFAAKDLDRGRFMIPELEPIVLECRQLRQILRNVDEEKDADSVRQEELASPANDHADDCIPPEMPDERDSYVNDQVSTDDNYTRFDHSIDDRDDNYMRFDHSPDDHDEDAISLFAESMFTDCGSSRRDEYVPRPVAAPPPPHTRVYHPTPIVQTPLPSPPIPCSLPPSNNPSRLLLLSDYYQPVQGTKSAVFHGVCFFNIILQCTNPKCRYPHADLSVEEIERRLAALGTVDFIEEYMYMREWKQLRRLYGPSFLREAERRQLTRVVLEMAMDFTSKARAGVQDYQQAGTAHEAALTLLSLNPGSVRACADLLRHPVNHPTGTHPLWYLLFDSLANTANFSRFKPAFIELAGLLVEDNERLTRGPVAKILERVCILPHEARLVRAMVAVVQLTDAATCAELMTLLEPLRAKLPDDHLDDPPPLPPQPAPVAETFPQMMYRRRPPPNFSNTN